MIPLQEWIRGLGTVYDTWGYLFVFLGTLVENTALLGLILPGGTLALLGAFYARLGTLNLGLVIVFAWLGTVLGYHCDYLFGRFVLGRVLPRWSVSRLGRRIRLAGRMRLARMFLTKHGGKAILLSHLVGHLRSFIALSAGMTRMSYLRFLLFELLAALLWNTLYSLLGYFIAIEIDTLLVVIERAGWGIAGAIILIAGIWYIRRYMARKARQRRRTSKRNTRQVAGV